MRLQAAHELDQLLTKLVSLPLHEYVPSNVVGPIHLGLGQIEKGIDWLNRACHERSHWVHHSQC